jgi:hypothetical protein
LATAGLVSSTAFAGTVVFDPPHVDAQPGGVAEFDVSIGSSDLPTFDTVNILFGSNDGFPLEFAYDWNSPLCFGLHACGSYGPPPAPFFGLRSQCGRHTILTRSDSAAFHRYTFG